MIVERLIPLKKSALPSEGRQSREARHWLKCERAFLGGGELVRTTSVYHHKLKPS